MKYKHFKQALLFKVDSIFKFHNFDTVLIRRYNGDPLMHTSTDR